MRVQGVTVTQQENLSWEIGWRIIEGPWKLSGDVYFLSLLMYEYPGLKLISLLGGVAGPAGEAVMAWVKTFVSPL